MQKKKKKIERNLELVYAKREFDELTDIRESTN